MKILEEAKHAGISITVIGGKIEIEGPRAAVDLGRRIAERKAEVLRYLTATQNPAEPDPDTDFSVLHMQALHEVDEKYFPGTIPFIREYRPTLWQEILTAEDAISESWIAGRLMEFREALREWLFLMSDAIIQYQRWGLSPITGAPTRDQ